ncbi:MAG TPA: amino acid ABC transporter permease [Anaerolineae bacterium]|nr:amino acid ABC transporter permease [Anaerolineae bacterium]
MTGFDRWWGLFAAVAVIIVVLAVSQPDPYWRIIKFLGDGIKITVTVTLVSYVCILVVGLIAGLGRVAKSGLIRGIASVYVEVIRGIPLLVQLYIIYFASPKLLQDLGNGLLAHGLTLGGLAAGLASFRMNAELGAIAGLTVCYGAYVGEIYRAGIQSIPRGQMEAARSLGMSQMQAMRYVVLPQAIRVILPPLGNEFVSLLKDSSLVSTVAVTDMTRRGREFMGREFIPLEVLTLVALFYLLMTVFSARIVSYIERKTSYVR